MFHSSVDCRDRTAEFFATVSALQKAAASRQSATSSHDILDGTAPRPLPHSYTGSKHSASSSAFGENEFETRPGSDSLRPLMPAPAPKQQSQFTQAAQHIGRSIHQVTEKLEKLGKLARQRSLFNDPTSEINELTYVIKTDLSTLHGELEVLHNWVQQHRAGSSSSRTTDPSDVDAPLTQHAARNSSAIVETLKQQLMYTTKSFQEVLQVRTQNLKEQNQRRKQFEANHVTTSSSSAGGAAAVASMSNGHAVSPSSAGASGAAVRKRGANPFDALMSQAASAKQHHRNNQTSSSSSFLASDNEPPTEDDELGLSFDGDGITEQTQLLQSQPIEQDDYLTSRAEAVESIESTIVELGEMYKRLVHIVGMQEEITLRIDANMDATLDNMDRGHQQLLKYYESISGGKWLIIKIFAVLLAFLVFFMVFVA